ncbi:hypothetical protein J2S05_002624 [Alkalicoccobacillus murimartini]|uniref:Uncharacterized protein n=1 Tax=Alkalicoccobacillus murimartini TaxID=171685 RepID=A0ABT9YJN8_9BACI|nr:hypothetical protein [Alkalicoccobacillus murimartini]
MHLLRSYGIGVEKKPALSEYEPSREMGAEARRNDIGQEVEDVIKKE